MKPSHRSHNKKQKKKQAEILLKLKKFLKISINAYPHETKHLEVWNGTKSYLYAWSQK